MQTVTGCHIKVFQLAGGQAAREQRCARQIVNRIVMVDGLGQRRTRLFGGQLEIRNEYHEVDRAVNRHTNVMHMAVFEQRHTEAAEDRRCGVIRMALYLCRYL